MGVLRQRFGADTPDGGAKAAMFVLTAPSDDPLISHIKLSLYMLLTHLLGAPGAASVCVCRWEKVSNTPASA